MTTDEPKSAEQVWRVGGAEGSHVEHPTRGGFKAATPEAARWAAVLLNEDHQALLDTVAALEMIRDDDDPEVSVDELLKRYGEEQVNLLYEKGPKGIAEAALARAREVAK